MSTIGELLQKEVNRKRFPAEGVTANLGVYKNLTNGFWYAIDWNHKPRAAFREVEIARKWCRTANEAHAGLPETNADYETFNEAMKAHGWWIVQLLGDCQVWDICWPIAGGQK